MRPRTLAVLAAAVVALGAFIFFYERELPGTEERRRLEKRAFRLEADEVVTLEIERDGRRVRLERAPAPAGEPADAFPPPREWRVTAPFAARADRQLADELAAGLAGLEVARELEGASRAEVGLEPPRGRITWSTGERQGVLEVGGDVPASGNLVATSSARPAPIVVARSIAAHLEREPGDWRDKQVVAASRDEIERIRLVPAGGGEEIVLARAGESFRVERPYADAADPDAVDPLLSDLTSLRAERFLDAPLAAAVESALAAGPGRLEVAVKGETAPLVVELGAEPEPGGARPARVAGQALETRTRLDAALARPATEWRSKRWAGFDSWRVERIRVAAAAGAGEAPAPLELARADGDWTRGGEKIGFTEVGDLLYAITSMRAARLLVGAEAAAVPAGAPALTIVLADGDGAEETLTLHGEHGEGVAARVSGREVVLLLEPGDVAELRRHLVAVREAEPLAPEPAAAEPGAAEPAAPAPPAD